MRLKLINDLQNDAFFNIHLHKNKLIQIFDRTQNLRFSCLESRDKSDATFASFD